MKVDPLEELQRHYCPPLDEALFLALASDYDLNQHDQKQGLVDILDDLKAQAETEQELELLAPVHEQETRTTDDSRRGDSWAPRSVNSRPENTKETDSVTSITTGLSNLRASEVADESGTDSQDLDIYTLGLEHSTTREKEEYLAALFPTLEQVQVAETVHRCHGDVQRSIDELLNLSFISDDITKLHNTSAPVAKGIDAFLGDGTTKKSKKRKHHKRQDDDLAASDRHSSGTRTPTTNVWQSAAEDISFVTSRTQVSPVVVKKIYEEADHNIASTIRRLISQEALKHKQQIADNEVLGIQAAELKFSFPNVPDKYLFGSLLLCQMQPSLAKDVLDAMLSRPSQDEGPLRPGMKLKNVAQYTPLNLTDDEDSTPVRNGHSSGVSTIPGEAATLLSRAAVHNIHAQQAFGSASTSARLAKSNHLYGGASAYYAALGHENRARSRMLQAAAADSYAAAQTTASSVDLHGISVADATRIAQRNVEAWWEGLGDRKYVRGGVGSGYKIIVGVGTHSDRGIGRLGPAVSKMLIREGWKVNVQRGEVIVEGRLRR